MAFAKATASCPTPLALLAGKMKPYLPVSGSSMVYEYLMPAEPLAQSSLPPRKKEGFLDYFQPKKYCLKPKLTFFRNS